MRAFRYSTAFAVLAFMIAGVIYSSVCDASCALYGCSLLLQESAPVSNDPHAHCHSRDEAGSKSASEQHDSAGSNSHRKQNSDDSPACASHLYANALIPRIACGQVVWHAQAVIYETPQIAFVSTLNLTGETAKPATFKSPPTLAMLSMLRI
jgi:hypothetical protein